MPATALGIRGAGRKEAADTSHPALLAAVMAGGWLAVAIHITLHSPTQSGINKLDSDQHTNIRPVLQPNLDNNRNPDDHGHGVESPKAKLQTLEAGCLVVTMERPSARRQQGFHRLTI